MIECLMNKTVSPVKFLSIMTIGIISISFGSILIRFTSDVHPIMIATYRLSFSSIILITILKIRKISFAHLSKKEWLLCTLSGLFLSLHFITWITSLSYTSIASSVVLVTMNPVFVGLLAFIFLKEKLHIYLIGGILLSVAGSIILTIGDSGGLDFTNTRALTGNLLALTGALMVSLYLLIGSQIRKNIDLMTYITTVYSISAIILIITSFFLNLDFTGYKTSSYIYMLLLAILPQLIGHTSYNWALKHLQSSMVAITTMGEPIGASILAYLIFKESITIIQGIGIALIFMAIMLASGKGKKN